MSTSKSDLIQIEVKISNNQEIPIMRFLKLGSRNDSDRGK